MSQKIDYGNLMHRAMRTLIRDVLADVQKTGKLPGDHRFIITFDTLHPDVEMADHLSDRYPGDMTIIMQHWFDNLDVSEEGFAVTLSFGNVPEPLYIPYDAITTFADPSVEFGLRFETQASDIDHDDDDDEAPMDELVEPDADDTPRPAAEVVSLDKFRK
ncbi:hypothetical protein SAMN05428995_103291 [Loktanella sp. DSM 29012]|uniref:ClpXP protease specificity-enhancing factor SspB n=1 Tax=Loktanella gaetbuli TaxID=2881335 RepID=A0ABS8BQN0_9RHOB|nr:MULTISPECIES: ClpXP protease specificity-enhancing factor SspB [Loktanella]MCB5198026.1 ClpXP protease specificity-enhancing factor SspB [Loktanella gaetbuli]SEQ22840.1 hypothetical protein SAMN05428995_103291 [Loktanella sp. DSM 29012]